MPRRLLENIKENLSSLMPRLERVPFQPPDDISQLDGYYDEPLVPEQTIEEFFGIRIPQMEPPTIRPRNKFQAVNESLIEAVVQVESSGKWDAVSNKGAVGLMQVIPKFSLRPGFGAKNVFQVAEEMGVRISGIPRNAQGAKRLLMNPEVNRQYGTQYLKALTRAFDGNIEHALIAYNWGPTNTRRWIERGADRQRLPEETRNYTQRIQAILEQTGD